MDQNVTIIDVAKYLPYWNMAIYCFFFW